MYHGDTAADSKVPKMKDPKGNRRLHQAKDVGRDSIPLPTLAAVSETKSNLPSDGVDIKLLHDALDEIEMAQQALDNAGKAGGDK